MQARQVVCARRFDTATEQRRPADISGQNYSTLSTKRSSFVKQPVRLYPAAAPLFGPSHFKQPAVRRAGDQKIIEELS